jgi:signal transduction histidine kinase
MIDEDYKGPIQAKLALTGHRATSTERIECKLRCEGERWASLAMNAIDDGAGQHMGHLAMVVDVTEQRKLQEQLIVSDRMASVGTLAAGVAHEINNPLAVILANLHLAAEEIERLIMRFEPGLQVDDLNEEMRDAQHAAERVKNIVRDLKIFSRVQEPQTGPIDVQPVIESSLRMAWNEIRHRAKIVRDYQTVPPVEGSESRLGQVFLNLITNAAHAMQEGQADRNELGLATRIDDLGRIVVEISDTGSGMSPEVQSRIFTPFFTTKPTGVGTGLGLSICRQIVHSLGGDITVDSTLGSGTTFRIVLPQAKSAIVPPPRAASQPIAAPRRARILVVDDELVVGSTVRRLLASDHEVATMNSAQQVIEHLSQGARYDIILCDLMMPEVTGMDLYAAVCKLAPEQAKRMIFMTGGAFTHKAREFLSEVENPRVEKPFEPTGLKDLVNTRLIEQT